MGVFSRFFKDAGAGEIERREEASDKVKQGEISGQHLSDAASSPLSAAAGPSKPSDGTPPGIDNPTASSLAPPVAAARAGDSEEAASLHTAGRGSPPANGLSRTPSLAPSAVVVGARAAHARMDGAAERRSLAPGATRPEAATLVAAPPFPRAASVSAGPKAIIGAPVVAVVAASSPVSPTSSSPLALAERDRDGLKRDVDVAFSAIIAPTAPEAELRIATSPALASLPEVRELFISLAAHHMRQVRGFMIGLQWGEASSQGVVMCEAATQSLLRAAKKMELSDLCLALEECAEALRQITSVEAVLSAGATRDALVASYAKLADQLPPVFALERERGRREAIIVHSLLQQVPGVGKLTIEKIYAAGLTGLDAFVRADPDDIAATAGISESLATGIVDKFRRYREQVKAANDGAHDGDRKRLAELLVSLRELHQQFELHSAAWSEEAHARKKELRRARVEVLLETKVHLARLGEVERLSELERLPFGRKIDELEKYLRDAGAQSASPGV
jgi:hypothetical protein